MTRTISAARVATLVGNLSGDERPLYLELADGAFHVIPRAQHALSRKSISSGALRVLYRLHEAGYRACLVGGAVRVSSRLTLAEWRPGELASTQLLRYSPQ